MDTNKMLDLKALAEAAGSDEWYAAGDLRYCDDKTGETHGLHHDDGRFIAAASPAAILALLAEIERLESAKGDPVGSFDKHMEYMQENIRLKAENEDYRSGQDRYEQIIDDLKAENAQLKNQEIELRCQNELLLRGGEVLKERAEALRKDAERYRFVRKTWCPDWPSEKADAQIDAAMAKEAGQ